MKGPVEPVHRSVPETIQEVIELTGFLCFLFRSTPTVGAVSCQSINQSANKSSSSGHHWEINAWFQRTMDIQNLPPQCNWPLVPLPPEEEQ